MIPLSWAIIIAAQHMQPHNPDRKNYELFPQFIGGLLELGIYITSWVGFLNALKGPL